MKKNTFFSLLLVVAVSFCQAQIRISTANIDNWVKANLAGQGVVIGNIKHVGNPIAQGTFASSGNVLQLQKGLVLSTGNIYNISGFNGSYNLSAALGNMSEPEIDADLAKLIKERLYDISMVEFDFVPMGNSVQFNYQFGSDEYPEYVGSAFNDIFAFYISDESSTRNIALIPGKSTPVSINTVNHKSESEHFLDNNPFTQSTIKRDVPAGEKVNRSFFGGILYGIKRFFTGSDDSEPDRVQISPSPDLVKNLNQVLYRNLQFDGITKRLAAQAYVEPYKKYHLKMIIADVSDNIYDSGVFIEDKSLTAKRDPQQPGFVDYPDMAGKFDPQLILQGKKLADILPDSLKTKLVANQPLVPAPVAQTPNQLPAQPQTQPKASEPGILTPSNEQLSDIVIYFDFDKSDIPEAEMQKIRSAVNLYQRNRDRYNMYIAGHTDSIGSLPYNYALSKRRNQAVINALKELAPSISPSSLQEKAFLQPAADNTSDEGRARNRRVEIIFRKNR